MTREEFIANSVAIVGTSVGWQTKLARRLSIDSRTIRRAVADGPSDKLAGQLLKIIGESAPQNIHAEWICGDGSDGREYLIHTRFPRFRCLVIAAEDKYDFAADDGVKFQCGDMMLSGFYWTDPMPQDLAHWMERAADALEGF